MSGGTGTPALPRPASRRPNPLRWWWYAQGGRLPGAHREWVLHDLTCRSWWLRHLARSSVQLVPVVGVLVVLIPGPFWIRGWAVLFGVLTGLYFALVYMVETTEQRALRAGYPRGTAQQIRDERRAAQRISKAQRYGLSWAPRPPAETRVHDADAPPAAPLALLAPLDHGQDRLPLRRPGGPDAAGPGGALRAPARWRSHRSPARTSRHGFGDPARDRVRPSGPHRPHLVLTTLDRLAPCHNMGSVEPRLLTDRLVLREWRVEDAAAALGIYGHPEVARWLSPEMDQVPDVAAMRLLLQHWIAEDARTAAPAGRWAIERREDGRLLGGAILLRLPPGREDLELGWQLHPQVWGFGYASETTRVLANWAFSHDVAEIFAVVRPGNTRAAATVRRNGMEWVGETGKYFGLDLQVFRLRHADFDPTAPATPLPPDPTAE